MKKITLILALGFLYGFILTNGDCIAGEICMNKGKSSYTNNQQHTTPDDIKFDLKITPDPPYCLNNEILFSIEVSDQSDETLSYQWFINDSNQNINSPNFNFTAPEKGNYNILCEISVTTGETTNIVEKQINIFVSENPVNDYQIPNMVLCNNAEAIVLSTLYEGNHTGNIIFEIDSVERNSFDPKLYDEDTIVEVNYYVYYGGCNSDVKKFDIQIKKVEAVYINILDKYKKDKYCVGDTIKVENKPDWNWEESSWFPTDVIDSTVSFILTSLANPKLIVQNNYNDCAATDTLHLVVNKVPKSEDIPNTGRICNGDTNILSLPIYIREYDISWNNDTNFIKTISKSEEYIFFPNTSTVFNYTITDIATSCSVNSEYKIDVIQVNPKIELLDSCSGNIYYIKEGSISNPQIIKWNITPEMDFVGDGTRAIIINSGADSSKISVNVTENIDAKHVCNGSFELEVSVVAQKLEQEDTTISFEHCGNILYSKKKNCQKYSYGYVDHNTGKTFKGEGNTSYIVDTSRVEDSNRTYFVSCDCDSTSILSYREVEALDYKDCDEQSSIQRAVLFPNPTYSEFNVLLEGNYRGEIQMDIFNSLGEKIHHEVYDKLAESDTHKVLLDSKLGVYYVRLSSKKGFISSVPIFLVR